MPGVEPDWLPESEGVGTDAGTVPLARVESARSSPFELWEPGLLGAPAAPLVDPPLDDPPLVSGAPVGSVASVEAPAGLRGRSGSR